ncbi:magnesium-transporting ATPase, P-type 1 [mine drainage metagenome]|uniref:Magnesium-transporting ATPase, P-type 1 n=1 Tax=mine drainage metagenome TaxID=410659 RepID=A0A1J5RVV3_9ZZZZ
MALKTTGMTGLAGKQQSELLDIARLPAEEALSRLDASLEGLLDREAEERLEQYGPNAVAHEQKKSAPRQLLEHFATPLSLLLLGLATVSFLTGEVKGAVVISIMVVLSGLLSFIQEFRSNKAAEKLREMVSTTASVLRKDVTAGVPEEVNRLFEVKLRIRPSHTTEVPMSQVVPGDIVHLSAGDMIPADLRIISAKDLFVNESALTGEAMPREKFFGPASPEIRSVLELPNICFMGTNVVSGTSVAVVAATGGRTYFGSIAQTVSATREQTSFDLGIRNFTWLMIRFMLVMVPLVFLINGFSKGDWMEALLFAVAVAVGLTPEMLPMIVTINLAKGAIAMSRKKVIVKRLNSIQNFGAMDVLCTDKTGTLTQDKVFLEKHVDIAGNESEHVLEYAYLNSHYQSGLKNLLDVAVLEHAEVREKLHVAERYAKIDEIPFDFQRRRMSVVVEEAGGKHILICKGAVEEVFNVCTRTELAGTVVPAERNHLEELRAVVNDLNEDGFRVIAVAYKELPVAQKIYALADESELILTGYIAFLDPPKETAAAAIAMLRQHGVAVKILTGDNEVVTRKVCREVGLEVEHVALGGEIEALTDLALAELAEEVSVFAKLSPQQKARVIKALHLKGHVVGFLGDGINDGPALRAADVGISVDTAVDIAKESADIILLEKSLMILEEGIIEGRKVFGNIVKYIKMGASSNFGNMFSVIGASAFLPFLPMAPVQILFNNLLYDFSQTAVATDSVDEEYVRLPRKWDIGNIARFMFFIGPISSLFDYATFFTMIYVFHAWNDPGLFQSGWFVESLLSQTLIVHVIRTGKIPFIQSKASVPLLVMTGVICAIGVALPYSQFAHALDLVALPVHYWLALAVILATYLSLTQLVKTWLIRRFGLG